MQLSSIFILHLTILSFSRHDRDQKGQHISCRAWKRLYSTRDQAVRYAHVTTLLVEGKQTHIPCKPKTLPTQEMRQWATNCCGWEIMLKVWTENASPSARPSNPMPLPFTSNDHGTHRFVPTTVRLCTRLSVMRRRQTDRPFPRGLQEV
jgi:hypothetical protein